MRLMRRTTAAQLLGRDPQFVLERVGQQLAVVRELTVDQPRADRTLPPTWKTTWFSRSADRDLVRVAGRARSSSGSARAGTLASKPGVDRRLQRRHLHRQPVGVGRDHPQLGAADADRARRSGSGASRPARPSAATRAIVSTNAFAGSPTRFVRRRLGEGREVLGAQRPDVERRSAGRDLDVLLGGPQLERRRRRAASARRRAAAGRGGPTMPSRSTCASSGTRSPTSMSVARSSTRAAGGVELDARERLDGAARRGHAGDGLQVGEQLGG